MKCEWYSETGVVLKSDDEKKCINNVVWYDIQHFFEVLLPGTYVKIIIYQEMLMSITYVNLLVFSNTLLILRL